MFNEATEPEINKALQLSWQAFEQYRLMPLAKRALLMRAIAIELEATGDELLQTAMRETHLPEARLRNERGRTIFQLNQYAGVCEQGHWLEARIDTAIPDKTPPKPDLRKMLVPLGPVVVFGASNFPFAYSTAGGDTACALAAGCPVIVKAHPAHPETSERTAQAILKAVKDCGMPDGLFIHIHGASYETGKMLVTHPLTKAVGFTGSFAGGKQLFDWANQRKEPIPVFAEMGSINPVFLFPEHLAIAATESALAYAASITLGVGQFCTNPGLIIGVEGKGLNTFIQELGNAIQKTTPGTMLHPGIASAYAANRLNALKEPGVQLAAESETAATELQGAPAIATVSGNIFLNNPLLHKEVFGPYSLVVCCKSIDEVKEIAAQLEGQLTATIMATETEIKQYTGLVETIKNLCGRIIFNGVPTGVEVCYSMQHGGPFPASTDSRFTSVGGDGIKRFARPLAYQNCPPALLPDELKDENPLGIWRMVNGEWKR